MIKLAFDREPFWLDLLPGVRVQFRPITVAAILVARQAAADVLKAGGEDATTMAGLAFTRSLARAGHPCLGGRRQCRRRAGRALARDDRRLPRPLAGVRRRRPALRRAGSGRARRKKRLIALAEWHFGGGEGYCAACPETCGTCPYVEHAPLTPDGIAAWAVLQRAAGQVRAAPGAVYALDFASVLLLADAMGALNNLLIDLLPEIEPIIVRAYSRDSGS